MNKQQCITVDTV